MWTKRVVKTILDTVKGWGNIMEDKPSMKCIVSAVSGDVVMPLEDAVVMLEIYSRAERYEHHTNWTTKEQSRHIWESDTLMSVRSLATSAYQCAKLAGKREEK
jgi:hypothetical protein